MQLGIPSTLTGALNFQFIDATGRVVKQLANGPVQGQIELDLNDLANGSYSVRVTNGEKQALGRFVLNR